MFSIRSNTKLFHVMGSVFLRCLLGALFLMVALTCGGGGGNSESEGNPIETPSIAAPSSPTNLAATPGDGQVVLTWSASASATSYHVKRATAAGGPYAQAGAPTGTTYTDTGRANGTTYYYVVSALNGGGESADSAEAYAIPSIPSIASPVDPNATTETKALFENLQKITRDGANTGLIFGQEGALDTGFFALNPDGTMDWQAGDGVKSDIRTITGKGPGIVSFDAAGIVGDWWDPSVSYYEDTKARSKAETRKYMQMQYARGGINAMAWHMANPMADQTWDSFNRGPKQLWRIAPPGLCAQMIHDGLNVPDAGDHFEIFRAKVDELAEWMLTVKDAQNRPIPIMLRLFHENNGDWFWWGMETDAKQPFGAAPPSPEWLASYQGIWTWIVDYMTNTKGVHQLLFITAPTGEGGWDPLSESKYLQFVPPLNLVDILGYDFYTSDQLTSIPNTWGGGALPELTMIRNLARAHHKVAAMAEAGYADEQGGGYQHFVITEQIIQNSDGSQTILDFRNTSGVQCNPGELLYRFWTEKQIKPLLTVGGVAYYLTWYSHPWQRVYGPVPDHHTGDDFRAGWEAHEILLEGEGQGGTPFDYYTLH